MPRRDRTGPAGKGPMTGRGGGYCADSGMPGFTQGGWGGFFARGLGRSPGWGVGGRGFCRWLLGAGLPAWRHFAGGGAPFEGSDPDLGKQSLKGQASALLSELDRIKKRLQEMEASSDSE